MTCSAGIRNINYYVYETFLSVENENISTYDAIKQIQLLVAFLINIISVYDL